MKIALKKTLFAALLGLCALIAIGGVLLIYPGTPGEAKSLAFKGYVPLPTSALLTVLDYMNVADTRLFVTDASTGSVYKIALRNQSLPSDRDVSEFALEPAAHGVVVDPLTGLANYRRLLDVLESETERTNRNNRPFAVLLLDLDGLKGINDTYGHLVGSRAIARLGDILRIHCRAVDTAARYGGDEFALVLPETEDLDARLVADRIRAVMAEDLETPPLSASIGISIYRGDGERIEKLLSVADQQLYAEKARRAKKISAISSAARRRAPKA